MVVQQAKVPFFSSAFPSLLFLLLHHPAGIVARLGVVRSFTNARFPTTHDPPACLTITYLCYFLQLAHVDGDDTSSSPLQTGGEGGWGCLWLSKPG